MATKKKAKKKKVKKEERSSANEWNISWDLEGLDTELYADLLNTLEKQEQQWGAASNNNPDFDLSTLKPDDALPTKFYPRVLTCAEKKAFEKCKFEVQVKDSNKSTKEETVYKSEEIEGWAYQGLVVHKAPGATKFNVSHQNSGLSLVSEIAKESAFEIAHYMARTANWYRSREEVIEDPLCRKIYEWGKIAENHTVDRMAQKIAAALVKFRKAWADFEKMGDDSDSDTSFDLVISSDRCDEVVPVVDLTTLERGTGKNKVKGIEALKARLQMFASKEEVRTHIRHAEITGPYACATDGHRLVLIHTGDQLESGPMVLLDNVEILCFEETKKINDTEHVSKFRLIVETNKVDEEVLAKLREAQVIDEYVCDKDGNRMLSRGYKKPILSIEGVSFCLGYPDISQVIPAIQPHNTHTFDAPKVRAMFEVLHCASAVRRATKNGGHLEVAAQIHGNGYEISLCAGDGQGRGVTGIDWEKCKVVGVNHETFRKPGNGLIGGFNARYMGEALEGCPGKFRLQFSDGLNPIRVERPDNGEVHIVMPMRI